MGACDQGCGHQRGLRCPEAAGLQGWPGCHNEIGGISGSQAVYVCEAVVPAGTPHSIIERVHAEIAKVLRTPSVAPQLTSQGIDPVGDSLAQLRAFIKADSAKVGQGHPGAGIKPD